MLARFSNTTKNRIVEFGLIHGLRFCFLLVFGILFPPITINAHPHPCKGNSEDWRMPEIAERLFHVKLRHLNPDDRKKIVDYTYNSYGCGHYTRGKHAGEDFDFVRKDDQTFYSLTTGTVKADGVGANKVIGIYDSRTQLMVLYLHASAVFVKKDKPVTVGTRLGNQGAEGNAEGAHVHIEVRKLTPQQRSLPFETQIKWLIQPAWGSSDWERPVLNPIPILYYLMQRDIDIKEKESNACLTWSRIKID